MSGEPEFIQINQDNPIKKGSTALIRNPNKNEISEGLRNDFGMMNLNTKEIK